jgi:hypothetical protein
MQTQTVTAIQVTTTTDELGNSTTETVETTVERVLFEPQQATERTDPRSPGEVTPAKFYLPVPLQLNADDEINDASGATWQVVGGSSVWGDQSEVPVQRASGV